MCEDTAESREANIQYLKESTNIAQHIKSVVYNALLNHNLLRQAKGDLKVGIIANSRRRIILRVDVEIVEDARLAEAK